MSIRVHVKGQIVLPEMATISVFDRGFLYGDSVFTTLAATGARPHALEPHLERLFTSARAIGIAPPARDDVRAAITATLAAAANPEARVRVIISRGDGTGDLDPRAAGTPNLIVIVAPRGGPSPEMYADGVEVAVLDRQRPARAALDPAVKSSNYLPCVLAVGEARARGAHEAILRAPDGGLAEGATSNLFVIAAGGVATPSESVGILAGVTRGVVLALCRAHRLPYAEVTHLPQQALGGADEAFITSSVRGILPVTRVDGRPIGAGRPGPITQRLMQLYAADSGQEGA